jgi:hypothetical protein
MNTITRSAAIALGTLALTTTASAQQAETPPASNDAILFANLDIGGSGNFTGVLDRQTNELCYILNVEASVAQALVANPGGYYVNIHNAAYPQGVVRAQLKG